MLEKLTQVSQNNGLPCALPRYARAALNFKPQGGDKDPRSSPVFSHSLAHQYLLHASLQGGALDDVLLRGGGVDQVAVFSLLDVHFLGRK